MFKIKFWKEWNFYIRIWLVCLLNSLQNSKLILLYVALKQLSEVIVRINYKLNWNIHWVHFASAITKWWSYFYV